MCVDLILQRVASCRLTCYQLLSNQRAAHLSLCAACYTHRSTRVYMAGPRKSLVQMNRELELKRELDSMYCNPDIIDPRSLVNLTEDSKSWFEDVTRKLKCAKHELIADRFNTNKIKKETLSECLEDVVDLLERNEAVIMHMLGIVDKSKTEVITAQQKVVKLQEELLTRKDG